MCLICFNRSHCGYPNRTREIPAGVVAERRRWLIDDNRKSPGSACFSCPGFSTRRHSMPCFRMSGSQAQRRSLDSSTLATVRLDIFLLTIGESESPIQLQFGAVPVPPGTQVTPWESYVCQERTEPLPALRYGLNRRRLREGQSLMFRRSALPVTFPRLWQLLCMFVF